MKALMTLTTAELTNKDFAKCTNGIVKELEKKDKSNFAIAKYVYRITTEELWKDDIETQDDLAKFLGLSRAQISLMKKTTIIKDCVSKHENFAELDTLTCSKLAELRPLIKEVDGEYTLDFILADYLDYCASNEYIISEMTQTDLRDSVKEYIMAWNGNSEQNEETGEEASEEADEETSDGTTDNETDNKEKTAWDVCINIRGDEHYISENDKFIADLTKLMKKYDII